MYGDKIFSLFAQVTLLKIAENMCCLLHMHKKKICDSVTDESLCTKDIIIKNIKYVIDWKHPNVALYY